MAFALVLFTRKLERNILKQFMKTLQATHQHVCKLASLKSDCAAGMEVLDRKELYG